MRKISLTKMHKYNKKILASKSSRRKKILKMINIDFSVIPSNVIEDFELRLPPEAFAEHWAREKARVISKSKPKSLVIGADTIVVLDSMKLGKPENEIECISMLKLLSGKTHQVITGVSLLHGELELDVSFNSTTLVSVKKITHGEISTYISLYNPLDKAGGYGIQDGFSAFISSINGCFYNVMGLPISKLYSVYKKLNYNYGL